MVLEKVQGERPEAASLCLARAWKHAQTQLLQADSILPPNGADVSQHLQDIPNSLQALLSLAAQACHGTQVDPANWRGHLVTNGQEVWYGNEGRQHRGITPVSAGVLPK